MNDMFMLKLRKQLKKVTQEKLSYGDEPSGSLKCWEVPAWGAQSAAPQEGLNSVSKYLTSA
jgi:hypothetical protein